MSCKPGDIALVVKAGLYLGWLVEVLYQAPNCRHTLPNGQIHAPCPPSEWVVRSLGPAFTAQLNNGRTIKNYYVSFADQWLRPIAPRKSETARDVGAMAT